MHREKVRTILIGPRAQKSLRRFLKRPTTAHLFSPAEADAERRAALHLARKTPMSCGNRPGTNRRDNPARKPHEYYTIYSYRRAIARACDKAFPPPAPLRKRDGETHRQWQARLTAKQKEELKVWRKAHRWHPHQLRHNYATNVRREYGLEAAQILLGHSSAVITDAVYAERDMAKAQEIAAKIG
jgi:integrase